MSASILNMAFSGPPLVSVGAPPSGVNENVWTIATAQHLPVAVSLGDLASGAAMALMVKFTVPASTSKPVSIQGAAIGTNVFGPVQSTGVKSMPGTPTVYTATVPLVSTGLSAAGVADYYLAWTWQWKGSDGKLNPLGMSEHRVFVTVVQPTDPWSSSPGTGTSLAVPWIGALALACNWAKGALTTDQIVEKIVDSMFASAGPDGIKYGGDFRYIPSGAALPAQFKFELFLQDVQNKSNAPVSCDEATAIAVSLANLLGASIAPLEIDVAPTSPKVIFQANALSPIGSPPLSPGCHFQYHQIAMSGKNATGAPNDEVTDSTFKLNQSPNPALPGQAYGEVIETPVGTGGNLPGTGFYLPQLVMAADLRDVVTNRLPPARIAAVTVQNSMTASARRRYTSYHEELSHLPQPAIALAAPTTFDIPGFAADFSFAPEPAIPRVGGLPPMIARQLTHFKPLAGPPGRELEATFWSDVDPKTLLSVMAELLSVQEIPPERKTLPLGITYLHGLGRSVLVLMSGAVAQLASVGPDMVNVLTALSTSTPL